MSSRLQQMLSPLPIRRLPSALVFFLFLGIVFKFTLAGASLVLTNGSFLADQGGWTTVGGRGPVWQPAGYSGPINLDGDSFQGRGGYLRWEPVQGAGQSVEGYVYQEFNVRDEGSIVKLSFAWAKGASGAIPEQQVATVRVVPPGGLQPVTVWRDSASISVYGEANALTWNLVQDLNISDTVNKAGTYQLQLEASSRNGDGPRAGSSIAFDEVYLSATPPDHTPPAAPQGLTARDQRTGGLLKMSWAANQEPDLAGYYLYRATSPKGPFLKASPLLIINNYFNDSGLGDGSSYYYYLTAADRSGNESAPSAQTSGIPTHDVTPPATPGEFSLTDPATGSKLELKWKANGEEDLAGYQLYRSESAKGPFLAVFPQPRLENYYLDTSVKNGTPYYYYLVALDTAGNASPSTAVLAGLPTLDTAPPDRPANFKVENPGSGRELRLNWEDNREPDLAGYYIYRSSPAQGKWERIDLANRDSTAYSDVGVKRGEIYRYRIKAFDRVGNISEASQEAEITARDFLPPAVPADLKLEDPWSGSELMVTWGANGEEDLAGYNLYRGNSPAGDFQKINKALLRGNSYMDSGLEQGRNYYYKVSSVDTTGNESRPSLAAGGKPYIGAAVSVSNPQGVVPARLRLEQSSSAIFVKGELSTVEFKAVAEDVYGREVPVSGVWRFATDRSRFSRVEQVAAQGASGALSSGSTGEASVIVEFVPQQRGAAPLRATASVRVLDWRIELSVSPNRTTAGSNEVTLLARLTEAGGAAVSDPGALVDFQVEQVTGGKQAEKDGKARVGRFREAGRALAVGQEGLPVATVGRPDAGGLVMGKLTASTIPARNRANAVLKYRDPLRAEGVVVVAASGAEEIAVTPGPAAYVGWEQETAQVRPGVIYGASLHAYDAFGNITDGSAGLKVSVQSPVWGKVEFSLDGGKTWITDADWHPIPLGSRVQLRVPPGDARRTGQYAYLLVRIDDAGGAALAPPPGVGQVNSPLLLNISQ